MLMQALVIWSITFEVMRSLGGKLLPNQPRLRHARSANMPKITTNRMNCTFAIQPLCVR